MRSGVEYVAVIYLGFNVAWALKDVVIMFSEEHTASIFKISRCHSPENENRHQDYVAKMCFLNVA